MWRYDTVDIVAVVESLQRCGKQPHCLSDLCSNDCHGAHRTFLRYTPVCLTSIKHRVKREIFGKRMNVPSVSTWFFTSQNRALSSMCHKMWNSNVHHHHHPWVCVVATTRTTWELHCVIEARLLFGNKKCVMNKKREKKFMKNIKKSPNFPRRSTSTMCGNHNLTLHFFFSASSVKGKFIKKLFIRDFVSSRFFSSHQRE